METTRFEASVVNGHIQLPAGLALPEHAGVVVTLIEPVQSNNRQVASPRLADPSAASDFLMEMVESPDASL